VILFSTYISAQNVGIGDVGTPKVNFHIEEDFRVLFGADTIGSGTKMMFLPDMNAFRVGKVSPGAASTYWNRDSIGLNSFASGMNTRAQGFGATAMGRDTEATNSYAFASGFFSNADGQYSTAMGFNTDAFGEGATALGYSTDAEKAYSFAAGFFAESQAESAVSLGTNTLAQSFRSVALGSNNLGGGNALAWNFSDPLLEVGNGMNQFSRSNALTILKDGRHGIITSTPKANLHVKSDGVADIAEIVVVLESDISNRPVLQFSETPNGDSGSGMSIEYDGRGSGGSNKMYINDTDGISVVTFENSGDVGIGVISPGFNLHLPNSTTKGIARARSWTTYSDKRVKSQITSLSYGLNEVMLLKPVEYQHHIGGFSNSELEVEEESQHTIGLIAQEVFEVIPEAVNQPDNENEELWGMEYEKLIPLLIKGMQEQQDHILQLESQIEELKEMIGEQQAALKKEMAKTN